MQGIRTQTNPRGLNLLALDGGGLAGLSSLYILQEIMCRLQERDKLNSRPEPREYFDLIAGTGTGAICAVMLGRLNMSLDDVIEKFSHLTPTSVSREKRTVHWDAWDIKPTELEEWLRTTVQESTGNADETMLDGNLYESKCKVLVYALCTHNLHNPCAFRTYPTNWNVMPACPIWAVLRASMAHDGLFPGTNIEVAGMNYRFTSAANARSNPTREILREANALFPGDSVASLVSIGVGQAHTFGIPQSNPLVRMFAGESPEGVRLLRTVSDIATSNERVAEEDAKQLSELAGVYHRLNMDQGTQKIGSSALKYKSRTADDTRLYMQRKEINEGLERVVASVQGRHSMLVPTPPDLGLDLFKSHFPPYPSPRFRGRKLQLERAREYFENGGPQRTLIIEGAAGVGKTQMALKCAEIIRYECVIFIDGSSPRTVKTILCQLATIAGAGMEHQDFLRWVENRQGRWLIVFDDVDDPSVLLGEYLAHINKYDIIITTRQPRSYTTSLNHVKYLGFEITPMDTEEASGMLLDISGLQKDQTGDMEAGLTILLHELKHLALAIALSGAFIYSAKYSVSDYYRLYVEERQQITTTLKDNGRTQASTSDCNPIHTACSLTLRRLDGFPDAGRLWGLLIPLYRNAISERLFRRAYEAAKIYRPVIPMTDSEIESFQHVKTVLNLLGTDQGLWNSQKFHSIMSQLLSLSLVTFNAVQNTYEIHSVVQDWARARTSRSSHDNSAALLALSIDYEQPIEGYTRQGDLMLHVYEILKLHPSPSPNDAWKFIVMYNEIGQRHGSLEIKVAEARIKALGYGHPDTLESTKNLANMYREQGRLEAAKNISIPMLAVQTKILGMEHPDTLRSLETLVQIDQHDEQKGLGIVAMLSELNEYKEEPGALLRTIAKLAVLHHQQGRPVLALVLEQKALDICAEHLDGNHPDTLHTFMTLATTYQALGRREDAEALRSKVLESLKHMLVGISSVPMLRTTANLAAVYHKQGHIFHASYLRAAVVDAARRLKEPRASILHFQACLAISQFELGRFAEAESLQETVLADRENILGGSHPDTLRSRDDLAATYREQGRIEKAKTLVQQALVSRERVLGEHNVATLRNKTSLAMIYCEEHQASEAEALIANVIQVQEQALGTSHPDTLRSKATMAEVYYQQHRFNEAESLGASVLATQRRVLRHEHPDISKSALCLAAIYYEKGQTKEAEILEVAVFATRRHLYGREHPKTALCRNDLLDRYYSNGRLAETEELKVEILEARIHKLGQEHDHSISSMKDLAAMYDKQNRLVEAENLRVSVLTVLENKVGKDHPDTLRSVADLAATYCKQKRLTEAEGLLLRVLATQRRILGPDDPKVLSSTEDLAAMYYEQGRTMVAEEMVIGILVLRRRLLGDHHPDTVRSMTDLVTKYYREGQIPEVEDVKRTVLDARRRVLGNDHAETLRSMADLATIYWVAFRKEFRTSTAF